MDKKQDEFEIVSGDGSEVEFSPVFKHFTALKPKTKTDEEKKKGIVIPEVKKKK